jgi:restriction system protein
MSSRRNDSSGVAVIELTALLPWWGGVMLAVASYGALHLYVSRPVAAVPLSNTTAFMIQAMGHALATTGQYVAPLFFLVAAVVSAYRRWTRRRLLAGVASSAAPDALNQLTWREFEMLVGEAFRAQGYSVAETGGSADGGVDVVLRKDSEKYFVQCKHWRAQTVGVPIVRELYGAMAAHGATGGFVVTSGRFTRPALEFAAGRNLTLIDGPKLHAMIQRVSQDSLVTMNAAIPIALAESPACPTCLKPMTMRTASRGPKASQPFWGCSAYPSCTGTRDFA